MEKSGGGEEEERREKSGNHVENYERSPSMRQWEKTDSGGRLTSIIVVFLLIKSGLYFVSLQWTLVILIGDAGRRYNGALVPRLFIVGVVPFGDYCASGMKTNEIFAHQRNCAFRFIRNKDILKRRGTFSYSIIVANFGIVLYFFDSLLQKIKIFID